MDGLPLPNLKLSMPSLISESGDRQWIYLRRLTENSKGDSMITFPIGPLRTFVEFSVDIGAQMSAIREDVMIRCHIVPDKKIWVIDIFGNSKPRLTARVKC